MPQLAFDAGHIFIVILASFFFEFVAVFVAYLKIGTGKA